MASRNRKRREVRYDVQGTLGGRCEALSIEAEGCIAVLNVAASGMSILADRKFQHEEHLIVIVHDIMIQMSVAWVAPLGDSTNQCKFGLHKRSVEVDSAETGDLVEEFKRRGISLTSGTVTVHSDTEMFLDEYN